MSNEALKKLVAEAVDQLGGLDIVVNNAARQQSRTSLEMISTEDFDATFKTNVYAMFWITKAAIPHLPPGSSIIGTASEQAYDPSENLVDYAQTKSCIVSFTKSMAKQLAPMGIRVNAVAPGPIWTPLQPSGGQPSQKLPEFGEKTLWKRPGQPAELAGAYVLLASSESCVPVIPQLRPIVIGLLVGVGDQADSLNLLVPILDRHMQPQRCAVLL